MASSRVMKPMGSAPTAWSSANTSGASVIAMRGQCRASVPMQRARGEAGSARLQELHLGAGELQHVAVLQGDGLGADGGAVEGRLVRPFDMGDHEAVGALGDR